MKSFTKSSNGRNWLIDEINKLFLSVKEDGISTLDKKPGVAKAKDVEVILEEMMSGLDEIDKKIIRLRNESLSFGQIAKEIGSVLSKAGVCSRYRRALKRIKKQGEMK